MRKQDEAQKQPYPDRPGYVLDGFTMHFWHKAAKKRIYAPPGRPFPIWRKVT